MEIENLEDCIDFIKDYKIGDKVLIVPSEARYKPEIVEITNVKRKYIQVGEDGWKARYFDKDGFWERPERGYSPRAYICGKVDYTRKRWLGEHRDKILAAIPRDYATLKKIAEVIGYEEVY